MYPNHHETVITLRVPRLIQGIIKMHQFAYGYDFTTVAECEAMVMRYIGCSIGLDFFDDKEFERMEMMSYNSGATFSPEDANGFLNMVYAAFSSISAIKVTWSTLTISGVHCRETSVSLDDLRVLSEEFAAENVYDIDLSDAPADKIKQSTDTLYW